MKTNELTGAALDWAVAKCEQNELAMERVRFPKKMAYYNAYSPTTYWDQGGAIIQREGINIRKGNQMYFPQGNEKGDYYEPLWLAGKQHGQTPLIAAMRCYVASRFGDEINIPEELR